VTRRASLPGVEELFRSSKDRPAENEPPEVEEPAPPEDGSPPVTLSTHLQVAEAPQAAVDKALSGQVTEEPELQVARTGGATGETKRPRHDEKVTFYCTASDLTRIERARLSLRAEHKLASDRGRIVRAALAEILDDFESRGAESALVRHLRNESRQSASS